MPVHLVRTSKMLGGPRAQFVDRLRVTYVPRDLKTHGSLFAKIASALHERVGDAGDAGMEHLVGHRKGIGDGGLLVRHPEQVLVRDDDQRIDALLQFHYAGFREPHPALALEVERLGDHPDREDA
jgi:hypothetical protein